MTIMRNDLARLDVANLYCEKHFQAISIAHTNLTTL
jgi:hypothetical protein